jgi:telomerase reverse transcriptase
MMGKRKHARGRNVEANTSKRQKKNGDPKTSYTHIAHPLLTLYYPRVASLREFLFGRLPKASRARKQRLASIPRYHAGEHAQTGGAIHGPPVPNDLATAGLSKLLDTTLVGFDHGKTPQIAEQLSQAYEEFSRKSQRTQRSSTTSSSLTEGLVPQSELVDFAISHLFSSVYRTAPRPPHVLCHGYVRANMDPLLDANEQDTSVAVGIYGLTSMFVNSQVTTIKGVVWRDLLQLLGKTGDGIMLDMILNCGIYVRVEQGQGNYYQLSGTPLPDLPLLSKAGYDPRPPVIYDPGQKTVVAKDLPVARTPSSINFVRNRMFYARPHLNARGDVRFGLPHIHALNRCSNTLRKWSRYLLQREMELTGSAIDVEESLAMEEQVQEDTVHLMMYMFPRQFGLHNAFTSFVSRKETSLPLKDYTVREDEIRAKVRGLQLNHDRRQGRKDKRAEEGAAASKSRSSSVRLPLPKRLRGSLQDLVQKMQKRHLRCSYAELLRHYCPVEPLDKKMPFKTRRKSQRRSGSSFASSAMVLGKTADGKPPRLIDAATPVESVSAYCRAVVNNLVPSMLLGVGEDGDYNWRSLMLNIDRLVQCRRFERLSLHAVVQKMKIVSIPWLTPPQTKSGQKLPKSDLDKRRELLLELLYYIFDSILMPLVRTTFHVTESSSEGNCLFYFRHDVWRIITEPSLNTIKMTMLEEIPSWKARNLINRRQLGFSHMRLVPKGDTVRPLMNMKRKPMEKGKNGKIVLGFSINDKLKPATSMLNLEKGRDPYILGSSLFSIGQLYPKLAEYRSQIFARKEAPRLCFVKVDVQKCFDSIPQKKMMELVEEICSEEEYIIKKHAELRHAPVGGYRNGRGTDVSSKKFPAMAHAADDFDTFDETVESDLAAHKRNTVFVDFVAPRAFDRSRLLGLLDEHLQQNWVKVGKRYYRQKQGIPQGSSVSSLLCNLFYADFERKHLAFLQEETHLLSRLIDDFLLITTNRDHALRFVRIMHAGNEEYGIKVKAQKTLVNFDCTVEGVELKQADDPKAFPYCGVALNTRTLEISKDLTRRLEMRKCGSEPLGHD